MRFYLIIVSAILLFSCNKEEGCTDCNALNFNPNADKNDNSCLYSNENRIGLYSVSDSMTDPFGTVFYQNYEVSMVRAKCFSAGLVMSNFAKIKQSDNSTVDIKLTFVGDTIYVQRQLITGPDNTSTADYIQMDKSIGYFKGDSIFLDFFYSDRFDPYYGKMWGVKK